MTIPVLSTLFVVLTAPFPQNPASAIGHVLLLEADSAKPYPLWNTVGYMADTDDVNAFVYLIKGIFGGFPAHYENLSFYEKIEEYSDTEKRDLWIYPLRISEVELKRYNDTVTAWSELKYPYKFFTINCVTGIYSLLEKTLDSIPKRPLILTPQNFIELLHKDNRLGEPTRFHADGKIAKEHSRYQIPHRYTRLNLGLFYEFAETNDFYFRLNLRPLLHSLKDRPTFYTPFMELELLTTDVIFNRDALKINELWYIKILSTSPQESFSWMINVGEIPKNVELGIGQTYKIIFPVNSGFLIRNTLSQKYKAYENLTGLRLFSTGSFSDSWRFGTNGEYLYNFMNQSNNFFIDLWLCFDISQNSNLLTEIKWTDKKDVSVSIMTAFYF